MHLWHRYPIFNQPGCFLFHARRDQDGGTRRFTNPNHGLAQAFKKFKARCELYFTGTPKDKLEEEKVSYLLIWSGDDGIELVSMWSLTAEQKKKLATYWSRFENYLSPKSNFRLARYKLRTLKQEPGEAATVNHS